MSDLRSVISIFKVFFMDLDSIVIIISEIIIILIRAENFIFPHETAVGLQFKQLRAGKVLRSNT